MNRPIKFRAWVKHIADNRWNWAYEKADTKAKEIQANGFEVERSEEDGWRSLFLRQWDEEHKPDDQYTITHRMAYVEEMGIYLNGKRIICHGYDILEVMQFTGLMDKNGKEIYEGDLVSWLSERGVIEYDGKLDAGFYVNGRAGFWYWYEGREFSWKNLEVIGNIHENPELLNAK